MNEPIEPATNGFLVAPAVLVPLVFVRMESSSSIATRLLEAMPTAPGNAQSQCEHADNIQHIATQRNASFEAKRGCDRNQRRLKYVHPVTELPKPRSQAKLKNWLSRPRPAPSTMFTNKQKQTASRRKARSTTAVDRSGRWPRLLSVPVTRPSAPAQQHVATSVPAIESNGR